MESYLIEFLFGSGEYAQAILPAGIALALTAASLAKGVGQFVEGRKQKKEGEALLRQKVERGEVPPSMLRALETQQYLEGAGLPGRDAAEAGMRQNLAQGYEAGLKTSRGPNQAQGLLEKQSAGVQSGLRDLDVREETYKAQQQQNVIGQQNKIGRVEQALDTQQYNRQVDQDAIARGQISAGLTNQYNAVGDAITSIGVMGPDLAAAFGSMKRQPGSPAFNPNINPLQGTTQMSENQYNQFQEQYPPLSQVPGGGNQMDLANQGAAGYRWNNPY